jgi:hypothetical protein
MVRFDELFAFCDLHATRIHGGAGFPRYYDRQGFPIPDTEDEPAVLGWARLYEQTGYQRVVLDELPDGSRLSTVWLGLDRGWPGNRVLIFETMRFPPGSAEDIEFPIPGTMPEETTTCLRYTTEEEATAMHHGILRLLRLRLGH